MPIESDRDYHILSDAFERHAATIEKSLSSVMPAVQQGADMLLDVLKKNRTLLICGNGGSAADSQHFAAEWICRYREDRPPLSAIALSTDTSALTAIGNDYSFEDIFSRQVEALGAEGDVLVAFTTSGQSKNILKAIKKAKAKNMAVIALTGERGRDIGSIADIAVVIPSSETARIQEVHQVIYHAWCEYIDKWYSMNR